MFRKGKPNNVHAVEAGDDGKREHDDRKKCEDFDDVIGVVRDDRFIGFLERGGQFLEVFEVVPDFFDFIDDIVKVDIEVVGEEFFVLVFELGDDGALRNDHAAKIDDVFFKHQDVLEAVAGMVGVENFGFEVVDVFTESVEKWKGRAKKVVGKHIKEVTWAFAEVFFAHFAFGFAVGEEFFDGWIVIVKGNEEVWTNEDVDFGVTDVAPAAGADRNVKNHKDVVVVVVDFWSLAF